MTLHCKRFLFMKISNPTPKFSMFPLCRRQANTSYILLMSSSRALLVVPPLIKYNTGPLLGPALLQSAARRYGHECTILDLNAKWLRPTGQRKNHAAFFGDHDKDSCFLNQSESLFFEDYLVPALQSITPEADPTRRIKFGFLTHNELDHAGSALALSEFGAWLHQQLNREPEPPNLVGLSLLHAGQLIPAVAVGNIARALWPQTPIIWGGPHVSGLGSSVIEADIEHRKFAADVYVTGHAEQTFVDILNGFSSGRGLLRNPKVIHGSTGGVSYSPIFENLGLYDSPLVLPAQSALGCAYGRCAFCTYPAIEPTPSKLGLASSVGSVADTAKNINASVSIKDSLATSTRLDAIGSCINGRAPWSACTKLSSRLDLSLLTKLERTGL